MCRLFGFRSVIQSQVHESLVHAENALELQSNDHPDGWGVSYYVAGTPHIIKSEKTAINDSIFQKISGIVSSQTVLAHIRKATLGEINILNTHPFQFGNWTFAHNGNIKNFANVRNKISAQISPAFKRFILGNTDSELFFYFLISHISTLIDITSKHVKVNLVIEAIYEAIKELNDIVGDIETRDSGPNTETYFTFILSNGTTMVGFQGGKKLYYSTYKSRCMDRDKCPSFSEECEAPTKSGYVNHLIFSSEPLSGENIWLEMKPFEIIGVDEHMKLTTRSFELNK